MPARSPIAPTRLSVPPRIAVIAASAVAGLLVLASGPASSQQTLGEIANQGRPIQTAPAPATASGPAQLGTLPTIGDIATRGTAAPQARAGCTPPPLPSNLPDGAAATQDQMRAAHDEFRRFVDAGQEFIACLDGATRANADKITVGGYLAVTEAHNRMVAVMEAVAARFNTELREYKAKGGK